MSLTRRQVLLAGLGLAVAPYMARIEALAPDGWLEAEEELPTITVTRGTGAYFRAGDLIRCEQTGENILVTAIQSDTLTVVRGMGAVPETALCRRDGLVRIANLFPAEPPAPKTPIHWIEQDLIPRYTEVA